MTEIDPKVPRSLIEADLGYDPDPQIRNLLRSSGEIYERITEGEMSSNNLIAGQQIQSSDTDEKSQSEE